MSDSSTEQAITLYAYLAEAPSSGIPGFAQSIVIPASQDELEEKIRSEAGCVNAEVVIIPPQEWEPPKLDSVSQQELTAKFPQIFKCVLQHMAALGLPKTDPDELINNGVVLPNPVNGKIYFVYKIKGEPTQKTRPIIQEKESTDPELPDKPHDPSICWYCETRPASLECGKEVTLNNGKIQQVITIPRCQTCEDLLNDHRKRMSKTGWINVLFFFAYITAIVLLVSNFGLPSGIGGTFLETLFWIVAAVVPIAFIIGTNVRTFRKTKSYCQEEGVTVWKLMNKHHQYPAVKELTDNAWVVGSLPSGSVVIAKKCMNCNMLVPISSQAGETCPHCGAYWSNEIKDFSLGSAITMKRCSNCNKVVPISSEIGDRCPHCGAYWSSEQKDN